MFAKIQLHNEKRENVLILCGKGNQLNGKSVTFTHSVNEIQKSSTIL